MDKPTDDKTQDVGELARTHGPKAIAVLSDLMENAFEDRDRIRAAEAILDRGHGKAAQAIIAVPASRRQAQLLAGYTDDQLVAVIEKKQLPRLTPAQPLITVETPASPQLMQYAVRPGQNAMHGHGPLEDAIPDEPLLDPLFL